MIPFEENEKVVIELREHWFLVAFQGVCLFGLGLLPLIFVYIFFQVITFNISSPQVIIALFLYIIWLISIWIFFFMELTNYYLDVWIVTNHRIIDVNQEGLFNRDVAMVPLEKIEDIKVTIRGILPTLMHMGNIYIQTASTEREFSLIKANDPDNAKHIIYSLIEDRKHSRLKEISEEIGVEALEKEIINEDD